MRDQSIYDQQAKVFEKMKVFTLRNINVPSHINEIQARQAKKDEKMTSTVQVDEKEKSGTSQIVQEDNPTMDTQGPKEDTTVLKLKQQESIR